MRFETLPAFGEMLAQVAAGGADGAIANISITAAREAQMEVEERNFSIEEAQAADEAFVTSASAFVMPVVEIDGVAVGAGTPGHRAVRLREIYLDESRKAAV